MIALAVVGRPRLLIADEPTTALDVSVQKEILDLLRRLTEEDEMALVLVSHDLGVVSTVTESVAVMYAGMVVRTGPDGDRVATPPVPEHPGVAPGSPENRAHRAARRHPRRPGNTGFLAERLSFCAALSACSTPVLCRTSGARGDRSTACRRLLPRARTRYTRPERDRRMKHMPPLPAGDRDAAGCSADLSPDLAQDREADPVVEAAQPDRALVATDVTFSYGSGPVVVENVSLTVPEGAAVGVVGESGSGKTTLARLLVGTPTPATGTVTIHGRAWGAIGRRDPMRRAVQMVFQNPYTALNPRFNALRTVAEVYRVCGGADKAVANDRARETLERVGISGLAVGKRPGELSGGQCQRVGIARALAVDPAVIVAD